MGFLNQTKRVDLGDGEWAEVRPLSITALRELRQRASTIEVGPGEEQSEAQGYELTRITLEECVVAWSDEEPVTKENVARLPYAIAFKLARAVGLGSEETPLASGSPSTDT